jgi:copper oxidase (laccase) domain-containing protein
MVVEPFKATFSYADCLMIQKGDRTWLLDLAQANHQQLIRSGVREENISMLNYCTSCRSDLFFSYRRDGKRTGRMLSTAMLLTD